MSISPTLGRLKAGPAFWFFGLLLPLVLQQLHHRLSPYADVLRFDTEHTYMPLAQRFLDNPAALFADPAHLMVAPGSFIYFALFGADNDLTVQGNLFFSGLFLLLAFDTLRRIAGLAAAATASWLIALSPLLPEIMIMALSEPPQMLCLGIWLWSCALICESPQRRWPVLLGGVALFLSILVRATYVYWIIAAIGACALLIWRGTPYLRSVAGRVLLMHMIAGAGTAGYITYNKVHFDFPMIATGSGAALYFGINTAVAGYEPPYYGLQHDHFQVLNDININHLSIEGDRRLSLIAKAELMDTPPAALAEMFLQKAGATLFFSQADLDRQVFNNRAWHVLLVVLSLFALWHYRNHFFIWMLGCILAYQVAIMSVVMHSTRYAIGAVELPLTFLAALGVASIWHARSRPRALLAFLAIMVFGISSGYLHQRYSRPLMPDLSNVVHRTIAAADTSLLRLQGFDGDPFSPEGATIASKDASIAWEKVKYAKLGGIPILQFHAEDFGSACKLVKLNYIEANGQSWTTRQRLNHMRAPQDISIGTLQLNGLDPQRGTLHINMDCPVGSRLKLGELKLHTVTRGMHYYQKALNKDALRSD